jgi:hypothetical protein
MAACHARGRARHISEDALERPAIPPVLRPGGIGNLDLRRQAEPGKVFVDTAGAMRIDFEGDQIEINVDRRSLDVDLSDEVLQSRLKAWRPPAPHPSSTGVLAKYARLVSNASEGAVTNFSVTQQHEGSRSPLHATLEMK